MDSVNLKKLAQILNLSVSTVSKAFGGSYEISPETKNRILALAKELNYQPNFYASGLRTQKTKTIAVIIPEIDNNFFTQAINGIESVAQEKAYHVLIYLTHEDYTKETAFAQHLQNGRVDGVLISLSDGTKDRSHLDLLTKKNIPVVFFDRVDEEAVATRVTTNDYESGYAATQHLVDQGCKRIAHLYFSKNLSIANYRMEGYLQALRDNKMPLSKGLVVQCTNDNKTNFNLIRALLSKNKRPDGIFSSFERLALHCYEVSEELKLKIPKDLKIISFSNIETAALLNPSLSTITQPAYEIGRKAALVLFDALEKNTATVPNEHIVIKSELIIRRSTTK
jgi:LacI family transcriptional regulator